MFAQAFISLVSSQAIRMLDPPHLLHSFLHALALEYLRGGFVLFNLKQVNLSKLST
jgi:hypothetical protein